MAIGIIEENKLVSLYAQGYQGFITQRGYLCGGIQGPLYPNPTTLSAPSIGFDPYEYRDITVNPYTVSTTYDGLGVGNPGIEYNHPGHLLGIIDTFSRMSYGIALLLLVHAGLDDPGTITPAVDISIPMMDLEGNTVYFGMSDIYPLLSEIPSDWLNTPTVNSNTGRVQNTYHYPTFNGVTVDQMSQLFANKLIFSYIGMPQALRVLIASLSIAAQDLATKAEIDFDLVSAENFTLYARLDSGFFPDTGPDGHPQTLASNFDEWGTFVHKCTVLSALEALNSLNGDNAYHDGTIGDQNEYRSLTELNSVVNLIPVQTVGGEYHVNMTAGAMQQNGGYIIPSIPTKGYNYGSYLISDTILNITDIPDAENGEAGTVNVAGTVTIKTPLSNPEALRLQRDVRYNSAQDDPGIVISTVHNPTEYLRKKVILDMSLDNQKCFDRTWLGVGLHQPDGVFESEELEDQETVGGTNHTGFPIPDRSDLIYEFNKTYTLGVGCNTLRMRLIVNNRHRAHMNTTTHDQRLSLPYTHTHLVLSGIIFVLDTHTHYPIGNQFVGYINSPGGISQIVTPNIIISFTITGSNMDPITHEISI